MEHTDGGGELSFSGNGDGCSAASDESGWTTYIDYFMETQQQQHRQQQAITVTATEDIERSRSSSSGDDDEAQSPFPELAKPSEISARLSLRKKEGRRRKKKKQLMMYDESLEDTATSPIRSPKLIDSRDSNDKHKNKEDECDEISDIAKKTTDELDSSDKLAHHRSLEQT